MSKLSQTVLYATCVDLFILKFCPASRPPVGKRDQRKPDSISEVYGNELTLGEQREKKETAVCVECCDTDLCNSGGCGTQGKLSIKLLNLIQYNTAGAIWTACDN